MRAFLQARVDTIVFRYSAVPLQIDHLAFAQLNDNFGRSVTVVMHLGPSNIVNGGYRTLTEASNAFEDVRRSVIRVTHSPTGSSASPTSSVTPTSPPSNEPTMGPTSRPTAGPTFAPSLTPSHVPTALPTESPSHAQSTSAPSNAPTGSSTSPSSLPLTQAPSAPSALAAPTTDAPATVLPPTATPTLLPRAPPTSTLTPTLTSGTTATTSPTPGLSPLIESESGGGHSSVGIGVGLSVTMIAVCVGAALIFRRKTRQRANNHTYPPVVNTVPMTAGPASTHNPEPKPPHDGEATRGALDSEQYVATPESVQASDTPNSTIEYEEPVSLRVGEHPCVGVDSEHYVATQPISPAQTQYALFRASASPDAAGSSTAVTLNENTSV